MKTEENQGRKRFSRVTKEAYEMSRGLGKATKTFAVLKKVLTVSSKTERQREKGNKRHKI